jgi:hypothetical protein
MQTDVFFMSDALTIENVRHRWTVTSAIPRVGDHLNIPGEGECVVVRVIWDIQSLGRSVTVRYAPTN